MNSPHHAAHLLCADALVGQTVYPWETGAMVEEMQELLCAHGLPVRVDGNFGYRTENEVRRFQRQHQLRVDGIVGPQTWATLKVTVPAGKRALRKGRTGMDVYELQGLLRVQGYSIQRTGIFDKETESSLLDFQKRHKLRLTGIVDVTTWTLLRGGFLKPN